MQSHSQPALLEASHLVKTFGSLRAVDDVSLTVNQGECLALLGPNGAGKTTTVEMLEGLIKPTSGNLAVFGLDMKSQRQKILERVGVLLQETNLYKRYTVLETLQLFASFYESSVDPHEIIGLLNLNEKANVQLKNLSGGQKQRVYLGACLINNPELIFLDEPTTGLDPQARRAIWDLLASLKQSRNKAILLTTHYMEEAQILADRVAIMDQGKIIAAGTPDQLIKKYCGETVVSFSMKAGERILSIEEAGPKFALLKTKHPIFREATLARDRIELITDQAGQAVTAILDGLRAEHLTFEELTMRSSSLEDVFIKLTGRSIRDE